MDSYIWRFNVQKININFIELEPVGGKIGIELRVIFGDTGTTDAGSQKMTVLE